MTVALAPDRPAGVDLERSLVLVPSPRSLERIEAAYGDPRTDQLVPWAVRPIPPQDLAEAQRRLIEGAPIPGVTDRVSRVGTREAQMSLVQRLSPG